jgi:signal transduction histidine kinase/DNA-binding NarL/FixJ family response regulator
MSDEAITSYDGLSLRGRPMKHEPWPRPGSRGQDKRHPSPGDDFAISGEAFRESFLYFLRRGGDGEALVSLMNEHAPAGFTADKDLLLDPGRWYGAEYYFYFNLFMKELMGDFGFSFDPGEGVMLSRFHRYYEAGKLRGTPWGPGPDGGAVGGLASINLLFPLRYIRDELGLPVDEILAWLNRFTNPGKSVDAEFIFSDDAPLLYSYEYTVVLLTLAEAYSNGSSFLPRAFAAYIAEEGSSVFEALLSCPPRKAAAALAVFRSSMSSAYRDSVSATPFAITVRTVIQDPVYLAALGRYRESLLELGLLVQLGGNLGVLERVYDAPLSISRTDAFAEAGGETGYELVFSRRLNRRKLASALVPAAASAAASMALCRAALPPIAGLLAAGAFGALGCATGLAMRRVRVLERRLEGSHARLRSQVGRLKETNLALLSERATLAERVEARTAELAAANRRLQELDKAKTDFFLDVSHELRTPLTLIMAPLDAIRRGRYGESLPRGHEAFAVMGRNCARLREQVDDLLAVARMDRRALKPSMVPLDLGVSCRRLSGEFAEVAAQRSIDLRLILPEERLVASLDRRLWERIFLNLVSNALKYTPDGGEISIALERAGGMALFRVKDSGIGIGAEDMGRVFDRFYRGDSGATLLGEGAGLGLALVKEACSLMGIAIEAASSPGEGSEFRLEFPASAELPAGDASEADRPAEARGGTANGGGAARVLVVEDNPDMAAFIVELLSPALEVVWAANGREALALGVRSRFDLVLTDVMMPVMDGTALFSEWRRSDGGDSTPFVFLTARASEDEKLEALRDGAVAYLYKPFSADELMALVSSLLGMSAAQRDRGRRELETRVRAALEDRSTLRRELPRLEELFREAGLSSRELEVASLVAEGMANKEIGAELGISSHRVANILCEVFRKTGCASRAQLMRRAGGWLP